MKQYSVLTIILIFILSFSTSINAISNQNNSKVKGIEIIITRTLFEPYPNADKLPVETKQKLINSGWKITSKGFYRIYNINDADISYIEDDNSITKVVNNKLSLKSGELKKDKIKIKELKEDLKFFDITEVKDKKGKIIAVKYNRDIVFADVSCDEDYNTTASNNISMENNLIQPMYDPMDPRLFGFNGEHLIPHNNHNDAWYEKNSYVTCNRFNGYLGDQQYYDKFAHPFKSLDNFAYSDCDFAIGSAGAPCVMGEFSQGERICLTIAQDVDRTATCSEYIDHKALYHEHTYYDGPSGY